MLIYLIVLAVVVLSAYLASTTRSAVMRRIFLGVAFLTLVGLAAARSRLVGTDTPNYVAYFDHIRSLADVYYLGSATQEYGFWILTWLVHFISDEYAMFFLVIALIVVGCFQWAIVSYSRDITVSFFMFIASGTYLFFFNGARQGVACAIYAVAIGPLIQQRFFRYLGLVLLASVFHKSALAMIPLYLIFNRPNNVRTNILIAVLGIGTSIFLQAIVGMASDFDVRYSGYATHGEGGGSLSVALGVGFSLFFAMFRQYVTRHREEYDRYFNMQFFGTMIGVVASVAAIDPSGFPRLAAYSSMSSVLLWPIVFENVPDRLTRFIVGYAFVLGFIALYVLSTERFSDLVPYTFNPLLPF
jgi:hypothetical protein